MLRFPLPFLAGLCTLAIVAASHTPQGECDSDGQPALGIIEVTLGYASGSFYADDRNYVTGNGIWFYQEGNGIWSPKAPGVYSGAEVAHDLQRGSHCGPTGPELPLPGLATSAAQGCTVPTDDEICFDHPWSEYDLLLF